MLASTINAARVHTNNAGEHMNTNPVPSQKTVTNQAVAHGLHAQAAIKTIADY
jgi:hypothetical protein